MLSRYALIMRGYFGIGAEAISKPMNLGNLVRSAHAFGASFAFLVDAHYTVASARSDTSVAENQLPVYRYDRPDELVLPKTCALIGVELLDEAIELPSFRHPLNAAYVFGPRTQFAVARDGGTLRSCGENPYSLLHQPRSSRGDRHV